MVAQLVERSLPTPEICSSNPDISKMVQLKIDKTKIKKKRPGMAHLLKKCIGSLGKLCWAIFLRSLTVKTIVTKG